MMRVVDCGEGRDVVEGDVDEEEEGVVDEEGNEEFEDEAPAAGWV